jgi:hypothetical protein
LTLPYFAVCTLPCSKVRIFWGGHNNFANLPLFFTIYYTVFQLCRVIRNFFLFGITW